MQIVNISYTALYVIVTNRNEISQTIIVDHHVPQCRITKGTQKVIYPSTFK